MKNKISPSITLNELTIYKPFSVDRKVITLSLNGKYQSTLLTLEEVKKLNEYLTNILNENNYI